MFPEIKNIPCESKKDAFALINWISDYIKQHLFLTVDTLYEHLELEPIPEEAYHYCWMSLGEFMLRKDYDQYYIVSREPIEIVD